MALSKEKTVELAQRHAEKQQFKKAVQQYELLQQHGLAGPAERLQLGEYQRKAGEPGKALLEWLDVGREFAAAGQYTRALAVYKHMLRVDPGLYPIHLAAARTYHAAGLLNDAVSQYQEAIGVLSVRGRPLDRLKVIRELLELDPENVRARIRLAEDFAGEGAVDDAVRELRIATDVLDRAGHTEDYARVAERLLFHAPDDLATCRRLAQLLIEAGNPQHALPKLQVCYRAEPGDVDVLEMLARAFDLVGQSHKALTVLKQIARIHDRNGLIPERNNALQRVLELDPADRSAARALGGRPSGPAVDLGFQELSFEEGEDDHAAGERPAANPGVPNFDDEPSSFPAMATSTLEGGMSELDALVDDLAASTSLPIQAPPPRVVMTPPPGPGNAPPRAVPPPMPPPMPPRQGSPSPPPPVANDDFVEFGFDEIYEAAAPPKPGPGRPSSVSGLATLPTPSVTAPPITFEAVSPELAAEAPLDANLVFDAMSSESLSPAGVPLDDSSPPGVPVAVRLAAADDLVEPESMPALEPAELDMGLDFKSLDPAEMTADRGPTGASPAEVEEDPIASEVEGLELDIEDDPVATEVPAPAPLSSDVIGALGEFDFFMAKGLVDEALMVLEEFPPEAREHPDVVERWARLEQATANANG